MLPNLSACSLSTGSAGSNLNSRNIDAEDLSVPDRKFTTEEERVWRRDLFRMLRGVKDVDPDLPEAVADWKSRILGHLNIGEFRIGLYQTAFSFAMLLGMIEENAGKNWELLRPLYNNWKSTYRTPEKVQLLNRTLALQLLVARLAAQAGAQNPQNPQNPQGQAQAA